MKKKIMLFAMGASMMAVPAIAQQGAAKADPNATWTRAEAQTQATEVFAKMDVNKDGKIDAADRTQMRAQREQARFTALDANKDGQISQAEWNQASANREAKAQERRAQMTAKRATAGQDEAKPKARGERRGKRAGFHHGMGRMGGRDGAQSVTQAEFVAKALERFDRLDADKDGNVTAAERQAFRETQRAERAAKRSAAAK